MFFAKTNIQLRVREFENKKVILDIYLFDSDHLSTTGNNQAFSFKEIILNKKICDYIHLTVCFCAELTDFEFHFVSIISLQVQRTCLRINDI